ncbi:hypothetical protein CASFOL_012813 [Castilleja foliolosa]|uniref:Ribosomal protein S10 n=1 Tax=Castilleja foliolosa TaxID=1961234 RepID=A0ABD3DI59_9LAMI
MTGLQGNVENKVLKQCNLKLHSQSKQKTYYSEPLSQPCPVLLISHIQLCHLAKSTPSQKMARLKSLFSRLKKFWRVHAARKKRRGIYILYEDVKSCPYEDVHVLWSILVGSRSPALPLKTRHSSMKS